MGVLPQLPDLDLGHDPLPIFQRVLLEWCLLGLQHPLSLFQAALPPLLSAMLPSAATTSPTSPSADGDPPSALPAGADPPSEKKRNKQSTRRVSDTLQ